MNVPGMFLTHGPDRSLFGVYVQQAPLAVALYERILQARPDLRSVVEFGTGTGALSLYWACWAWASDNTLHTYDLRADAVRTLAVLREMEDAGADVHFFEQDLSDGDAIRRAHARAPGPRLLFCDADEPGGKVHQLESLARVVGPRDVVVAHDYGVEFGDRHVPACYRKLEPWHGAAQEAGCRAGVFERRP